MTVSLTVWHWVLVYLALHAIIYGLYLKTSAGLANKTIYLQLRRYIPCALTMTFSLYLWQAAALPLQILAGHALVFLAWLLVYPLTYWTAFRKNTAFIDNHYDQAVGAYFFTFGLSLQIFLCQFFGDTRWIPGLITFIQAIFLLVPAAGLLYYIHYRTPVSESACMALLQTNPRETREFLSQEVGIGGILGAALLILFPAGFCLWANTATIFPATLSLPQLVFLAVLFIATGSYSAKAFTRSGSVLAYREAKDYFHRFSLFSQFHSEIVKNLKVELPTKTFSKPHTIIMVIGESASRYYMSAYRSTEHDTTPWMRKKSTDKNFILFRHAYACWSQTVPSLERALTEKNQYNDKDFNKSATLVDLARAAGYTTHWYSNQGVISSADTPVTLVGETADHYKWIQADIANTEEKIYDEGLLPLLDNVNPSKNNFVVLHLKGSHDNYINRYPKEFSRWGDPDKCQPVIDYDNSLAYTDRFLEKVFNYASKRLNLQAMLYFSDHGANPLKKRNPDNTDFIFMRIPLFLYLSPEYRNLYPDTAEALRSHEHSYFTNDLVYEMMAGIMNLESSHYDPTNSFASGRYRFNRDNLTTNLGANRLTEDTEEPGEWESLDPDSPASRKR